MFRYNDGYNIRLGNRHAFAPTVALSEDSAGQYLWPCYWEIIGKLSFDLRIMLIY